MILLFSCSNQDKNKLITPQKGVGKIKLGEPAPKNYNENDLELKTLGKEKIVTDIIVKSSDYRTENGFRIGTKNSEIISKWGDPKQTKINLKKGKHHIGSIEGGLFYDGIYFADMDNDKTVDLIWLTKELDIP